jgi:chromosome segregation ATPase
MADADAPLAAEQQKTASLTARLDETRQSLEQERADREMAAAALGAREEELATARAELASRHREFEAQRDELQEKLARLRQSNDGLQQAASAREESMALQLAEIDSLAAQLAEITSEYEQERFERQSMEAQGNTLEEKAARLATRIVELEESVAASKPLHEDNARLSGMLVSNNAEARGLREQVAKTEAYADALRRKLQGRAEEIEAAAAAQRSMQATLDQALAQIHELRDQVEAERRANVALSEQRQADREVFDEQLRQVRSELEAAEEAIAENQTVNEQLTSDLIETTGFRIALESQLAQADDDYQKDVKDLNRQLKRLRQQLEDYERKVSNKDAAISVLLTELAHKPQPAASEVEADAVIHRLGTRKQAGADDKPAHDRDRTTRLLVGTIEGQEVRFPLFKNKLTIGRTAHNDIQLKQQYISRRHAVVVCDNDNTRIVDWGSKNGIYVNGIRVSEKILKNGDQLTVGTAEFRFEERPKR